MTDLRPFFLSGFDITLLSSTMTVELLAHFTIIYLTGYITVGPHHCIAVQPEIWKIKPLHEYEFWSHWQNSGSSGIGVFNLSHNATQGKDGKPQNLLPTYAHKQRSTWKRLKTFVDLLRLFMVNHLNKIHTCDIHIWTMNVDVYFCRTQSIWAVSIGRITIHHLEVITYQKKPHFDIGMD